MPYTCRDVCGFIDEYAPPEFALEGDPIGLHLGSFGQEVGRLFLALELTPVTMREAMDFRPDMILVHHTPFFQPLMRLLEDQGHDRIVLELIRRGIALFAAHTNLDCVKGGVSDALAERLGLGDTAILQVLSKDVTEAGIGRVGCLDEPVRLEDFAARVKQALGAASVRYCGERGSKVRKVAVCGGAGAYLMTEALSLGADTYVTADVKHHEGAEAVEMGLNLIDGGHFATEAPVMPVLADWLRGKMPELAIGVSTVSGDPFSAIT
ncbi:MAG: Nif3-like dinuclear metal center hexameric protein [Clostridiales bacterium]|nr:Nif3-like dinuclear metal center hexameric protein [Clostridiales bacterium]